MKAFVFVNDNGAAYCRYAKNEIPAQFVYGVSKLEKMGFEVKVGEGRLFKDLVSFWKFKPVFYAISQKKDDALFHSGKNFHVPNKIRGLDASRRLFATRFQTQKNDSFTAAAFFAAIC